MIWIIPATYAASLAFLSAVELLRGGGKPRVPTTPVSPATPTTPIPSPIPKTFDHLVPGQLYLLDVYATPDFTDPVALMNFLTSQGIFTSAGKLPVMVASNINPSSITWDNPSSSGSGLIDLMGIPSVNRWALAVIAAKPTVSDPTSVQGGYVKLPYSVSTLGPIPTASRVVALSAYLVTGTPS